MATLTIEGRKVRVDDNFMQLSPEMQNQTVDEIARSPSFQNGGDRISQTFDKVDRQTDIGPQVFAPQLDGMDETDISIARSKNTPLGAYLRQQAQQTQGDETPQQQQERLYGSLPEADNGALDHVRAFATNMVDGVPVAGPYLNKGVNAVASGAASLMNGRSYDENMAAAEGLNASDRENMPISSTTGRITGAIAPMFPLGATKIGAQALGLTGKNIGTRALASAGSSAAITGADSLARGASAGDAGLSAGISAGIGGAIPFVGAGLRAGYGAVADRVKPVLGGLRAPEKEAMRRVGNALQMDDVKRAFSASDEATARLNGTPLINADRGGETTRALSRSVANQSPEARRELAQFTQDRFYNQAPRAQTFLHRIMRGATDDLTYQDSIKAAAQKANRPAYRAAFDAPEAQAMWTPRLKELMQSPAMQDAAKSATGRGANRAAVEGFKPIRNPFTFKQDGTFSLAQAKKGEQAIPTLQFWDQAKRNLDGMIGTAQRQGDKTLAADLMALKTSLVSEMDGAVPAYAAARKGAAGFFDAEDALEAGKKFVNINRAIPETKRVLVKMSKDEREAFAVGFAAELKDKIGQSRDSMNVINQIFGSPEAREKVLLALGKERFKEFESFINVERTADMLRQAVSGNSSSVRQFIEMGLTGTGAGVGGFVYSGGDWTSAMTAAAAGAGGKFAAQKSGQKVLRVMTNMLLSDDPRKMEQAINLVKNNKDANASLELIGTLVRSIGISAAPALAGAE